MRVLADGDLHFELATTHAQELDRHGRRSRQRQCLLRQDAQRALWQQLFGQRGAGRLQPGDFGESIAHLAVQTGILDGNGDVIRQELHDLTVPGVEDPRPIFGQHAKNAHHLALPPHRDGDASLGVAGLGERLGQLA